MNQWTVSEPDSIVLDEPVQSAQVRMIAGALNVVAAEGPARIEVTELKGEPLQVSLVDGVLTVTYQHLSWNDFGFGGQLKTMDAIKDGFKDLVSSLKRKRKSRAVVTLTLPADAVVKLGSVSADTTVSGLQTDTAVYAITGATTLVGLGGKTEANSVSGDVDAQSVGGELKLKTVNGDLTVVAGTATTVRANTVSGVVTLDLTGAAPADVRANTVSGDVAIRLPRPADTKVEAGSTTGKFSTAFEELKLGGTWGGQRLTGILGAGSGSLEVTTVSGSVSVLARPEDDTPSLVKELTDGSDGTE